MHERRELSVGARASSQNPAFSLFKLTQPRRAAAPTAEGGGQAAAGARGRRWRGSSGLEVVSLAPPALLAPDAAAASRFTAAAPHGTEGDAPRRQGGDVCRRAEGRGTQGAGQARERRVVG